MTRLAYYSAMLLTIRLLAVVMLLVLDRSLAQVSMAVLTPNWYFYLAYCLVEAAFLFALLVVSVRFYCYHDWLRKNKMTTYEHIQLLAKNSKTAKVHPSHKPGLSKHGVFKKESSTTAKPKGTRRSPVRIPETEGIKSSGHQIEGVPLEDQGVLLVGSVYFLEEETCRLREHRQPDANPGGVSQLSQPPQGE